MCETKLSPELKSKLDSIQAKISYDKVTVAFSLDRRDINGDKKNAFYSLTVSRKDEEGGETDRGFTAEEQKLVRCLLSKQVAAAVYEIAVHQGMMSSGLAADELRPILESHDARIAKLLEGGQS